MGSRVSGDRGHSRLDMDKIAKALGAAHHRRLSEAESRAVRAGRVPEQTDTFVAMPPSRRDTPAYRANQQTLSALRKILSTNPQLRQFREALQDGFFSEEEAVGFRESFGEVSKSSLPLALKVLELVTYDDRGIPNVPRGLFELIRQTDGFNPAHYDTAEEWRYFYNRQYSSGDYFGRALLVLLSRGERELVRDLLGVRPRVRGGEGIHREIIQLANALTAQPVTEDRGRLANVAMNVAVRNDGNDMYGWVTSFLVDINYYLFNTRQENDSQVERDIVNVFTVFAAELIGPEVLDDDGENSFSNERIYRRFDDLVTSYVNNEHFNGLSPSDSRQRELAAGLREFANAFRGKMLRLGMTVDAEPAGRSRRSGAAGSRSSRSGGQAASARKTSRSGRRGGPSGAPPQTPPANPAPTPQTPPAPSGRASASADSDWIGEYEYVEELPVLGVQVFAPRQTSTTMSASSLPHNVGWTYVDQLPRGALTFAVPMAAVRTFMPAAIVTPAFRPAAAPTATGVASRFASSGLLTSPAAFRA